MLDQPENRARVQALIDRIDRVHARFSALREDLARIEEHRDTLRKSAHAAEQEAEEARLEAKELTRAMLGKPGKALLEKRAKHRAAIETAEDYRALAREADEAARSLRVEMSPPARELETLCQDLRMTFSRQVLAEAVGAIAPRLKIVWSVLRAEYERFDFLPGARHAFGTHEENVIDLLCEEIKGAFHPEKVSAELPDDIRAALRKTATGFKPFSPLQIDRIRKGLPLADDALPSRSPIPSLHERKAVP